jgi:hypothetical protein
MMSLNKFWIGRRRHLAEILFANYVWVWPSLRKTSKSQLLFLIDQTSRPRTWCCATLNGLSQIHVLVDLRWLGSTQKNVTDFLFWQV